MGVGVRRVDRRATGFHKLVAIGTRQLGVSRQTRIFIPILCYFNDFSPIDCLLANNLKKIPIKKSLLKKFLLRIDISSSVCALGTASQESLCENVIQVNFYASRRPICHSSVAIDSIMAKILFMLSSDRYRYTVCPEYTSKPLSGTNR
jgi:hypothetical protein